MNSKCTTIYSWGSESNNLRNLHAKNLSLDPSIVWIDEELGQLEVFIVDLFTFAFAKSRPEEGSSLGAREMDGHDRLISADRHQLILLAVDINRGIVCAVSDLIEDSRLERLVGVVVAHFRGVVVAVE